ncbi:unnamed protein product [Rotaria sp. Silwood2]|nr:unnamed protein product [Rotaria sp. Silwood2]
MLKKDLTEHETHHTDVICLRKQLQQSNETIEQLNDQLQQSSQKHQQELQKRRQDMLKPGGNGAGNRLDQISHPCGVYVDGDQTVYIADYSNDRIVEWKCGATIGQSIAGRNEPGDQMNQLKNPSDLIFDKESNGFIICDRGNNRVMLWSRQNYTCGQIILSDIECNGLIMDNQGFLYVSDTRHNSVKRWRVGEIQGTIVAGGNGQGNRLDQLNYPTYVFVDWDHSLYVSDHLNHRVMKRMEGAKEGIVVAGGRGKGTDLTQVSSPCGVIVDHLGTIYVADYGNHRIMRWPKGATEGSVIVGGNGQGQQANQLNGPTGLFFDRYGNLVVVDWDNHRVQNQTINCPIELSSINGRVIIPPPIEPSSPQDDIQIGHIWTISIINSFGKIYYKLIHTDESQLANIEFEDEPTMYLNTSLTGKWTCDIQRGITLTQEIVSSSSMLVNHRIIKTITKKLMSTN